MVEEFQQQGIDSFHTALIICSHVLDDISTRISRSAVLKEANHSGFENLINSFISQIKNKVNFMFVFDEKFAHSLKQEMETFIDTEMIDSGEELVQKAKKRIVEDMINSTARITTLRYYLSRGKKMSE